MADANPINVMLVDDHRVIRYVLREALELEPDINIVAESDSSPASVAIALNKNPDTVIISSGSDDAENLELIKAIKNQKPETWILTLIYQSDQPTVCSMLKAGSSGLLLKNCSYQEVISAIRRISQGETYVPPILFPPDSAPLTKNSDPVVALTARDKDILKLIAEGKKGIQIAEQLKISKRTVDNHRQNLMKKLNLYSISALTHYAIRHGIASLD